MQIIGGVMEWIIGNTFPAVIFNSYGEPAMLGLLIFSLAEDALQARSGSLSRQHFNLTTMLSVLTSTPTRVLRPKQQAQQNTTTLTV